jgi:hypothetical protein
MNNAGLELLVPLSLVVRKWNADCEWKAQAGNVCAASFDWSCSGICKSVERMKEVHGMCSEGDGALWNWTLS